MRGEVKKKLLKLPIEFDGREKPTRVKAGNQQLYTIAPTLFTVPGGCLLTLELYRQPNRRY